MLLDHDQCYRAIQSRDSRFDGWFVTAVRTTGIYCRPSCPAITPKPSERRVLRGRRDRAVAWVPCLQAVPTGRDARVARVEHPR